MIFTRSINRGVAVDGVVGDPILRYVTTGMGADAIIGATARSVIITGSWPHFKTKRELYQFITQLERAWVQHESIRDSNRYIEESEVSDRLFHTVLTVI